MSTVTEEWRIRMPHPPEELPKHRSRRRPAVVAPPLIQSVADSVYGSGQCPWFRGAGAVDAAIAHLRDLVDNNGFVVKKMLDDDEPLEAVRHDCYADDDSGQCWHFVVVANGS
jgi:hypothetical protein